MFSIKKLNPLKLRRRLRKKSINWRTADAVVITVMVLALMALVALIYYQVRPMQLVDIKVPVSTEKPTYRAGENVNGIFFGEVFYSGEVRILRDVFCADYQGRILTDDGDEIFSGVSNPIKLQGALRTIGRLPADVPVGKNCVIQFVNIYEINTPFGTRSEQRTYFTQNFLIISDESDSEQEDLQQDEPQRQNLFDNSPETSQRDEPTQNSPQPAPQAPQPRQQPQTQPQPQPEPQQPAPAEPVAPPQCSIDLLGIRLFCS